LIFSTLYLKTQSIIKSIATLIVKIFSFTCALSFPVFILLAQNSGRFEESKRMALAYIDSEQFDKAAGRLEEVWEQDRSDTRVGESLALAYLNSEDRYSRADLQKQAFTIIDSLVSRHERVSFLVHHSHEKLAWLQGREWHQYCSGRLSITQNGLAYLATKGKDAERHSFESVFDKMNANAIELDTEDGRGVFHLKTPKGGYVMAVRTQNRAEATFLVGLIKRSLEDPEIHSNR